MKFLYSKVSLNFAFLLKFCTQIKMETP